MRRRRLARRLLSPVFLLALAPGCLVFQRTTPVAVLALDAETRRPIPDAEVRLSYPLARSGSTSGASGTTGGNGVVQLRAAPPGDGGVVLHASAKGYMSDGTTVSAEDLHPDRPTSGAAVGEPSARVIVELYAEPRATIELVLPSGYRGLLKAEVKVKDDDPHTPGQRFFSYAVPPSGVVVVTGPPVFRRGVWPEFRVKYADGTELSRNPNGAKVGFWWLKCDGDTELFLVGTSRDYAECRPAGGDEGRERGGAGGRGRGHGRHGHGGMTGADPNPAVVTPQ